MAALKGYNVWYKPPQVPVALLSPVALLHAPALHIVLRVVEEYEQLEQLGGQAKNKMKYRKI